jgi:acetyl-CoA C-acetyltransferase
MKYTQPIHIVAARRSPIGRLGGSLQSLSAIDLAAQVSQALIEDVGPHIDSVIFGQVLQAGVGMNLARQVALRLGLPQSVPGYTVNIVCGSGLKAVALGATEIETGEAGLVLAGGAESMSQAPYYAKDVRNGKKFGDAKLIDSILADGLTDPSINVVMGETAERLAALYNIGREEQDRFALESHRRACAAATALRREIVPMQTKKALVERDEHPRVDSSLEKLAGLKPAFSAEGTITPGNASGINDGAAAVLLAGDSASQRHQLKSRARIVAVSVVGCDPALMGLGPVGAIRAVGERTGWNLDDVEAIEINEAFAVQTIACIKELGLNPEKVNRRGGAVAWGHPIGCSGARVLVTLLHILEDHDFKRGIASLCIGGGMGIAMAIERD